MEITRDYINYTKQILKNYFFQQEKEMELRRLVMQYDYLIEEEIKGCGISYENIGNGCSVSYPKDSYVQQLIKEQRAYELEADEWQKKHKVSDKMENIEKRLKQLPENHRTIINAICKYGFSNEEVAKLFFDGTVSHQTVSDKFNAAIVAFIKREEE